VKTLTLSQIAAWLNVSPPAVDKTLTGLATLEEATETELSFLGHERYLPALKATNAAAVIAHKRIKIPPGLAPVIIPVDDADLAMARILAEIAPPVPRPSGIDPMSRVDPAVKLGKNVAVGPFTVIGKNSVIGDNTVIHNGVSIGDDVVIGNDCEIFPNAVIRERITIGHRVILHACVVLGTDGFGYRWDGSKHAKIPQIGTVIIEDDVEIGSGTCVDRAKFGATRIGRGTKIDNLVQVGHNVKTGAHCIIVGMVGIAGSVTLGNGVVLGGHAALKDHITIGDGAIAAACAGILSDVAPKEIVSGAPALPHRQTLREQGAIRDLPELRVTVRKLEKIIAKLMEKEGSVPNT
jgi:UDP-3-O-[3-hydroxymyristoyl] glucosamine N-acyltransferase